MFAKNVLNELITWAAAIAMIVFVFFLIRDVIRIIRGESTILKVVINIICVLFLVGVMYAAESFETFGKTFKGFFEDVITEDNLPDFEGNKSTK